MGQIRMGFQRVSAGSAAREAEEDAKLSGTAGRMRVQAGSAARAAEEAKRLGVQPRQGAASFSLRAQGGRVDRADAVPKAHPHQGEPSSAQALTARSSNAPPTDARSLDVPPGHIPPQASLVRSGTSRLTSILRGFFLSDETP